MVESRVLPRGESDSERMRLEPVLSGVSTESPA
jgi:hypothetical protein